MKFKNSPSKHGNIEKITQKTSKQHQQTNKKPINRNKKESYQFHSSLIFSHLHLFTFQFNSLSSHFLVLRPLYFHSISISSVRKALVRIHRWWVGANFQLFIKFLVSRTLHSFLAMICIIYAGLRQHWIKVLRFSFFLCFVWFAWKWWWWRDGDWNNYRKFIEKRGKEVQLEVEHE